MFDASLPALMKALDAFTQRHDGPAATILWLAGAELPTIWGEQPSMLISDGHDDDVRAFTAHQLVHMITRAVHQRIAETDVTEHLATEAWSMTQLVADLEGKTPVEMAATLIEEALLHRSVVT